MKKLTSSCRQLAPQQAALYHSNFSFLFRTCPEVTNATRGMPQIANYLARKACMGMINALFGLERKSRIDCSKTPLQSQSNASKNSATKFECSVTSRHLNFDYAGHTGPLSVWGSLFSLLHSSQIMACLALMASICSRRLVLLSWLPLRSRSKAGQWALHKSSRHGRRGRAKEGDNHSCH